jgi:hypothetical protein
LCDHSHGRKIRSMEIKKTENSIKNCQHQRN